jgi:uncharacterized protein (DUF736 family)
LNEFKLKNKTMAYELKSGQGSLFKNEQKKEDKHPDYRGEIKDQSGKVWALAAWVKEGKKGKFLSLSMSDPREKPDRVTTVESNDLPF